MPIILTPTLPLASTYTPTPVLTVEAEYGSTVVEGTTYTAAHHQPVGTPYAGRHLPGAELTGRPSPCNDPNIPALGPDDTILVSHVDLDTIGGCLRALPEFARLFLPARAGFWELAEWVDVRGAHKLPLIPNRLRPWVQFLRAFWAWSKANTPRYPRDVSTDITKDVMAAGTTLFRIFANDDELWAAGLAMAAAEAALNERTFVSALQGVVFRRAALQTEFVNHLYATPTGMVAYAVVSFNEATHAVTVSLADPIPGVSCRAIVQELWGPDAGGHDGIAGSPRGKVMLSSDAHDAVAALLKVLPND